MLEQYEDLDECPDTLGLAQWLVDLQNIWDEMPEREDYAYTNKELGELMDATFNLLDGVIGRMRIIEENIKSLDKKIKYTSGENKLATEVLEAMQFNKDNKQNANSMFG